MSVLKGFPQTPVRPRTKRRQGVLGAQASGRGDTGGAGHYGAELIAELLGVLPG